MLAPAAAALLADCGRSCWLLVRPELPKGSKLPKSCRAAEGMPPAALLCPPEASAALPGWAGSAAAASGTDVLMLGGP